MLYTELKYNIFGGKGSEKKYRKNVSYKILGRSAIPEGRRVEVLLKE